MEITWSGIKEVFYAVGSVAGLFAVIRPLFESKHKQDDDRFAALKKIIDEHWLYSLSDVQPMTQLDGTRIKQVDDLVSAFRERRDVTCFSGPFAKEARHALHRLTEEWVSYRRLVKEGPWSPYTDGWTFNRRHFQTRVPGSNGLVAQDGADDYLEKVRSAALPLKNAYKKLMLVGQLHLLEWPIRGLLLRRRARALGLEP